MTAKNPYRKRTHLSTAKTKKLLHCFCLDLPAHTTAQMLALNRNTVQGRYNYIRLAIYTTCQAEYTREDGVFEIDESYFWPKRVKGKRGRWAGDKIKVLGLLKREGRVFVEIVPDCSAKSLLPIIRGQISPESIVNTDGRKSYDGLVDLGYQKHYRVHHSKDEFARGTQHINGIESFWSFTKRRLAKFNGIAKHKFPLYLKECERRFNCWLQHQDMYKSLLKLLRNYS